MLKDDLISYRKYCESQFDTASRLLSMFRPRYDYAAKIKVINKLLLDIDLVDVQYTNRDLEILNQGKLAAMLKEQKNKCELPQRFRFEKMHRLTCHI